MIVQEGNQFIVYANNGMVLGKYKTKQIAEEKLKALKIFLGDKSGTES